MNQFQKEESPNYYTLKIEKFELFKNTSINKLSSDSNEYKVDILLSNIEGNKNLVNKIIYQIETKMVQIL